MAVSTEQQQARDAYSKSLAEIDRLIGLHKRASYEGRLNDAFQLLQRISLECDEMRRWHALAYPNS